MCDVFHGRSSCQASFRVLTLLSADNLHVEKISSLYQLVAVTSQTRVFVVVVVFMCDVFRALINFLVYCGIAKAILTIHLIFYCLEGWPLQDRVHKPQILKGKESRSEESNRFPPAFDKLNLTAGPDRLVRGQELCESRGGRPGLPVLNGPYGLCGLRPLRPKATIEEK